MENKTIQTAANTALAHILDMVLYTNRNAKNTYTENGVVVIGGEHGGYGHITLTIAEIEGLIAWTRENTYNLESSITLTKMLNEAKEAMK